MQDRPIGVFDSGLGGLTVVQALADLLPDEDLLYIGDTARYPYGERTATEVRSFALAIADDLVSQGVKLLVVACNSAAAVALDELRKRLDIPVVGVVEPGLRAAAKASRTGRALVIGTRLTAESRIYERTAERLRLGLRVTAHACPGFVELVEDGVADDPETAQIVAAQLAPLLSARVDALVLGCTHFPLLARAISAAAGRRTTLVSSADETAFEVRDLLERMGWERAALATVSAPGRLTALTTGEPARFAELAGRFLGARSVEVRPHRVRGLDSATSLAG